MTLTSPQAREHLDVLADIFARTFSDYWSRRSYVKDGYIAESTYDWDASRIAVVDGEIAAHFGVWDFQMRIGQAAIRVAGIGAVATLEPYRGKGIMAQTAADCVARLDAAGYDVSLLFGIPDFYHRFGYEVCFPEITTSVETMSVDVPASPVDVKPYDGEVADLAEQYNRENEGVTGTYIRPTYRRNRRPNRHTIYTFAGGYVCVGVRDEALQVADCAGDPRTILEVVRAKAMANLCRRIDFTFLPPRSAMGEYLSTIAHTRRITRSPNGGPMMKIVNLGRTLRMIVPTLELRLASSALRAFTGTLGIAGEGQHAILSIDQGRVSVVSARGDAAHDGVANVLSGETMTPDSELAAGRSFARLLVGDGDPHRICRQAGIELSGVAADLVPVLFPDQEPSTILWDRF